ncbi:hypothetical protein AOLI_G00032860 [Acnodon oligacanthus]
MEEHTSLRKLHYENISYIPETSSDLTENSLDQIWAEAEAEAITPPICTDLKEQEVDNNQPLGKKRKDVEIMFDNGAIKCWADLVEETEGTINQTAEKEALKNDFPVKEDKTNQ